MENIKKIDITVQGKDWQDALDKAYEKASKKVKIDGFRQGKAPKEIFLKKYGEESLFMDASDIVIDKEYRKMIDENKDLEIVAQPEMELKSISKEKIEFTFVLTLKPEVKLGKYKGLDVKKEEVKATKEEINEEIKRLQERYAEELKKDGKVENGDTAVIDFEGFKDGVAFAGGKGENYSLKIGSNTFIPGFEEQIIGMSKGEEKDINLKFPSDYHSEELKGQPVVFKVKVREIKQTIIPELNKDFFEDLGIEGVDTKEKLEKHVEEHILAHKEHHAEEHYIDDLLEAAAKNTEIDIPEAMIKEEQDRMLKQYEENLMMQGVTLKQFYEFTKSDEKALREQMKEEATKRVTYRLMLEEIAKQEKIEVTDAEALEQADDMAEKYNMTKEELIKNIGGLDMIIYDIKMRKAIETLKK